nr:MAG TPA: hypothetical protein [Caudoviricetes sp.]
MCICLRTSLRFNRILRLKKLKKFKILYLSLSLSNSLFL